MIRVFKFIFAAAFCFLLFNCENPFIDLVLRSRRIEFNTNGGSLINSQILYSGERINMPEDPVKEGNYFAGWFIDNVTFEHEWNFSDLPEGNLTLYAKWQLSEAIPVPVDSVSVTVTAPAAGAVPSYEASGSGGFTISDVSWARNGDEVTDAFLWGNEYTVTVSLAANAGYTFTDGLDGTVTINGFAADIVNNGETALLSYTFPKVTDKAVTGIMIVTPPDNMTYTHGEYLNLSGLAARIIYYDETYEEVSAGEFEDFNIFASPADGLQLSRLSHNERYISVIYSNNSVIRANTGYMTVNQKTVTITGVTAVNRPYNGTITVELTGGTLHGIEAFDADNVNINHGSGTIENKDIGNNKPVTANITLTGSAASNYTLTQPSGIFVNITYVLIPNAEVFVMLPAANMEPSPLVNLPGPQHFTAEVIWQRDGEAFTGNFEMGILYTAVVTLTANPSYAFETALTNASINGSASATTVVSNNGTAVVLSRTFQAAARAVIAVTIDTQPVRHLDYVHGENLDLTGLSVKLHYSDASTPSIVPFGEFSIYNITTEPEDGSPLIRSEHNNTRVSVICSNSAARSFTNALSIEKASGAVISIANPSVAGAGYSAAASSLDNGQNVEYAVSTNDSAAANQLAWQASPVFTIIPTAAETHYWYARSAENENFFAGVPPVRSSNGITVHSITFDSAGGNYTPPVQFVFSGAAAAAPNPPPTRAGYVFIGWRNGSSEWNFAADTAGANITLTAAWAAFQLFSINIELIRDPAGDPVIPTNMTFSQSGAPGQQTGLMLALPSAPAGYTYGFIDWLHTNHTGTHSLTNGQSLQSLNLSNTNIIYNSVGLKTISVIIELIRDADGFSSFYSRQISFEVTG